MLFCQYMVVLASFLGIVYTSEDIEYLDTAEDVESDDGASRIFSDNINKKSANSHEKPLMDFFDPDNAAEFVKAYNQQLLNRDIERELKKVDRNKDGLLLWKEFHDASMGISEEDIMRGNNIQETYVQEMKKLKALWAAADLDGNNVLNKDEAKRFLISRYPDEL